MCYFVVTDYKSFSETITIPSGQSSVSYTISLVDDTVPESTESFDVRIRIVSGYRVTSNHNTAVVTIIDNDSEYLRIIFNIEIIIS